MPASEDDQITHLIARLGNKYPDLDSGTITAIVEESRDAFEGNRIRDFVPLFVERRAEDRLHNRK